MPAHGLFRGLDVAVIGGYLAVIAALGIYFSTRRVTTERYFVGNRAFPGWVIGLSMFATSISSVTFLAFPAAALVLDWRQVVPNLTLPLIALAAVFVFIPFFRQGRITSAFEYLEQRFGPGLRLAGAVVFLLMQFLRLGTVLYLVSLPMQILTGASSTWIILLAGVVVAFYTAAGGFVAVTWIDVLQSAVLITGAATALACIVLPIPGGLAQVLQVGAEHGKFNLGGWRFDPAGRTIPILLMIGILNWLSEYTTNQNVVQRYLAASSTREARKATLICCLMSVPIWIFFFFVGTSLFVFYQVYPDAAVSGMLASGHADRVFPYFIVHHIPAGLAGLVVAGLLAATLSLDSSINSVATITTVDIVRRHLIPGRTERFYLWTARIAALSAAAVMIGGALLLARVPKESMVDLALKVTAVLFGGGVAGVFLIGFLTTRVNYGCALLAFGLTLLFELYLVLSCSGLLPAALTLRLHWYWVGVLTNLFFMFAAYGLSWLAAGVTNLTSDRPVGRWASRLCEPLPPQRLHSLTIWSMAGGSGAFFAPCAESISSGARGCASEGSVAPTGGKKAADPLRAAPMSIGAGRTV